MDVSVELCLNLVLALVLVGIVVYYRLGNADAPTSTQGSSSSCSPVKSSAASNRSAPGAGEAEERSSTPKTNTTLSRTMVKKSDKVYLGCVKRYSKRNGMGFISCVPLREKYQVDVRIFQEEFD